MKIILKNVNYLFLESTKRKINVEKQKNKEIIVSILIDKLIKIKHKNEFYKCASYYNFLFSKYVKYLSINHCLKLYYLQNKHSSYIYNTRLLTYICRYINNTPINIILNCKIHLFRFQTFCTFLYNNYLYSNSFDCIIILDMTNL